MQTLGFKPVRNHCVAMRRKEGQPCLRFRRLLSLTFVFVLAIACGCTIASEAQTGDAHDLLFSALPRVWDEGLPLGNGMVGALVWQRENVLRIP